MANIITVENVSVHSAIEQFALKSLGYGRFARPGKSGEPDHCTAVAELDRTFARGNFAPGPEDILAFGDGSICVGATEHRAAGVNFAIMKKHESTEVCHALMIVQNQRG